MKPLLPIEVVVVILSALVFSMLHASGRRRANDLRDRSECVNNLRKLSGNYEIFIVKNGRFITEISTNMGGTMEYANQEASAYLHFRAFEASYVDHPNATNPPSYNLVCPRDRRIAAPLASLSNSNISYFLSMNPPSNDTKWILAGNRNISLASLPGPGGSTTTHASWNPAEGLHGDTGFVLLLDGSIDRVDNAALNKLFKQAGNSTNRLAIP